MRILMLLAKSPDPAARESIARGLAPRLEYLVLQQRLGAELLDFDDVARARHPLVRLAALRGPRWGLAALGLLRREQVDGYYCTGEDVGLPLAMMLAALGDRGRVTAVIHNGGTPKRRVLLRSVDRRVWRDLICLSDEQRRVLCDDNRLPPARVHRLAQWIDPLYFDPGRSSAAPDDTVLSVGRESRDYATLAAAARRLPCRFRVVASGWAPHAGYDTRSGLHGSTQIEVERGGLSHAALRDRYAAARLVVVPLQRVRYAAGVTAICEAMAMGKAVVATRSPGVCDYLEHGRSGLLVPPGDASALAAAIDTLYRDPARCAAMGAHNRHIAETELNMDRYAAEVARLLQRPDVTA